MNNLLISIAPAPNLVRSEGPSKNFNKGETEKGKFDSVIQEASKKLDKAESSIKKKDTNFIKNKKIDLEELQLQADISMQETMIINLLAEYLQIPVEEIQQVLETLEIEPIDLTNQENFGKFISELYGQPLEDLLLNNNNIKSISTLWEKMEQIGKSFSETFANSEVNLKIDKAILHKEPSNKQIDAESDTLQNMQVTNATSLEKKSEALQIPTMVAGQEEQKNTKQLDSIQQVSLVEGDIATGLGLQIPLEAFNTTTGAKMWDQTSKQQLLSGLGDNIAVESQVLAKIEITQLEQGKEIQMDLAPKELGKLSFKLVEENGILTAQIRVESEKTKELLLQSIDTLKEGLKAQGLLVGDFTVNVRDHSRQSQMHQERQKSSKRIEEIIAKHLDVLEEEPLEETKETSSELDIMV